MIPDDQGALGERMADAARRTKDRIDPRSTMETAVRLATTNVRHCDAAGSCVVRSGGRLETTAYTDEIAISGDLLQYTLGEGPCLDAMWEEGVVHSSDLASDPRWPAWAPRMARGHDVRSMLCLRLFTRADTLGALNLYSHTRDAFGEDDWDDGVALAAHVSGALAAFWPEDEVLAALDSRALVGRATGVLMGRYDVDASGAFAMLARVSAEDGVTIRDLAQELFDTGRLPSRH